MNKRLEVASAGDAPAFDEAALREEMHDRFGVGYIADGTAIEIAIDIVRRHVAARPAYDRERLRVALEDICLDPAKPVAYTVAGCWRLRSHVPEAILAVFDDVLGGRPMTLRECMEAEDAEPRQAEAPEGTRSVIGDKGERPAASAGDAPAFDEAALREDLDRAFASPRGWNKDKLIDVFRRHVAARPTVTEAQVR
jgi:hypothetical protein